MKQKINPHDLRKGNLILWEDESEDIAVVVEAPYFSNGEWVLKVDHGAEVMLWEFVGIPLNDENTMKYFGWENDFSKGMMTKGGDIIRMLGHKMKLEYIHELQNLYYWLHRDELKPMKQWRI